VQSRMPVMQRLCHTDVYDVPNDVAVITLR